MSLFVSIARGCAVVSLAVLASCGGNASRVEPFRPTTMVVLGDEWSLVLDESNLPAGVPASTVTGAGAGNGRKYNIDYIDPTGAAVPVNSYNCLGYLTWAQYVASSFGFQFKECKSPGLADPANSFMLARPGADVTAVQAQAAAYGLATFNSKTLVTVMAGMWDVINAYNAWAANTLTRDAALARVQDAGVRLGNLVNQITNTGSGGRVIYVTLPNMALSPFAATAEASLAGSAVMLQDLSRAFNVGINNNSGLRNTVTNNGQWAGIVLADSIVGAMATMPAVPNGYGIIFPGSAACVTPVPNCTDAVLDPTAGTFVDLQPNAIQSSIQRYLWTGDRYLGPSAHVQIGSQAQIRAVNNPF